MGQLSNLLLEEFSIVRGADVQPANPGAVALVYKSTSTTKPKEKAVMAETAAPAQPKKKTRGQQIAEILSKVLKKGTTVYESSYTSTSNSKATETVIPDDPTMPGDDDDDSPTVIIINDSAPVEKAAPDETGDGTALAKALEPLTKAVTGIDTRLAAVEKLSTGSRQLGKGLNGGGAPTGGDGMKFPEFTKFLEARSELSAGQRLTKATLTSSGWSYGLGYVEAGNFIDYIVDQSVVLKQCRTIKMPLSRYPIDKIGLGSTVLVKGTPGTDPGDTVSLSGPTQVLLQAQEVLAIVSIGDDTLEDNIEGDAFVQHLLGMIARSASNELETAAMLGDTAVADTGIKDRWDGWYKQAKAGGAHVIEGMADADRYWPGTGPVAKKMTKLLKAIPSKYRMDLKMLRAILHNDLYLDYNDAIASLNYVNAFASVAGVADLPIRGVPNLQMPMLSTSQSFTYSATPYTNGTFVMVTDIRNLIFGIHREIKIEPFRQPRKRCTDYVLSMRADVKIENPDAIGIYDHAQVQ